MSSLVVVTDLDGTLLDHHDYSWQSANPAINLLQENTVPIIFNTSKTFDEARSLQKKIGIDGPLIVENGSALFVPSELVGETSREKVLSSSEAVSEYKGYIQINFGIERAQLLTTMQQLKEQYSWQFTGFNDWGLDEIQAQTGLDSEAAKQAANKQFSEPFLWQDTVDNLTTFTNLIQEQGYKVLKGGRFYHLQGDTNKAKPLLWLKESALLALSEPVTMVCLGDNQNDIDMLNAADVAVCVKSPVAPYPTINNDKQVIYTQLEGPKGWNEAIKQIIR